MLAPAPCFRYLRAVRSRLDNARAALFVGCAFLALAAGGAVGCNQRAKSPVEAWQRLVDAVAQRDARALYKALDQQTRWSWMTVRRSQREAHDIVLSNFPESSARDQQLRRFEAAAIADDEADLFAAWLPQEGWAKRWEDLARDLPKDAVPAADGADVAVVTTPTGRALRFRRGDDGGWGFSGFMEDAEQIKRRALADLEQVRNNAADLERAATRAGK